MAAFASWVAEDEGGETGVATELLGGDLIDGDGVVEAAPGDTERVGTGKPEGASLMAVGGELVVTVLDHRDVFVMFGERFETFGEGPFRPGLFHVREPTLVRYAPSHGEEDHPFGARGWGRCGGEAAEAEGFEEGQRDASARAAEEVAAVEGRVHGQEDGFWRDGFGRGF